MKKTIFLSFAAALLISCSLDTAPSDSIASGNMWTTEGLADKGMAGLYQAFYLERDSDMQPQFNKYDRGLDRFSIEALSFTTDHYQGYHSQRLLAYSAKSASFSHLNIEWKFAYTLIHAANDAIANLRKAGLSDEKYNRYMCEAHFIRAYAYHRLNILFQGVPLYTEPVANEECTRTQSSAAQIWDQVLSDLKYCIENEYFADNNISVTQNFGRPSKGAAYALRGMTYMWMSTDVINAAGDLRETPSTKYYDKAAADFEKVGECGYGLWEGEYIDFFKPENEKDKEMIFAVQYDVETGYTDQGPQWILGAWDTYSSWGHIKPAADFVDSYQTKDGAKFEWKNVEGLEDWDKLTSEQREVFFLRDGMKELPVPLADAYDRIGEKIMDKYYLNEGNEDRIKKAYQDRDPRLLQTVLTPYRPIDCYNPSASKHDDGMVYGKEFREPFIRNDEDYGDLRFGVQLSDRGPYGYLKFTEYGDVLKNRSSVYNDWPLIRYTDVLLQWAEALTHLGEIDLAIEKVNMVRNRAHMPALTNGGAAPNGVTGPEDMMERIRYERRVELCAEGVNFFDEIRWGTWKEMKFKGQEIYGSQSWWGRSASTGGETWYFEDYLWPWSAPLGEIQKNQSLSRRDGWAY